MDAITEIITTFRRQIDSIEDYPYFAVSVLTSLGTVYTCPIFVKFKLSGKIRQKDDFYKATSIFKIILINVTCLGFSMIFFLSTYPFSLRRFN